MTVVLCILAFLLGGFRLSICTISATSPDLIEIMPGIASKVIRRLTFGNIPVIAGGLIETKQEITEALGNGAEGVSTGKQELWYI